jgi:uncharacterized protein with von Willebrand factor type A (vWA) domain
MPAADLARDRLHAFLRALEETGVGVSTPKKADFLLALTASPPADVDGLYWRARLTLVSAAEAFPAFDAVFDAFFRGGHLLVEEQRPAPPDEEGETAAPRSSQDDELAALEPAPGSGLHASPLELHHQLAVAPTSDAAQRELQELSAALAGALPAIAARRCARARRGRRLDLRRVLAAANRAGGEIVTLEWRRRPRRPRRVLLLIDVSGSLRQSSPDALRFAHRAIRTAERVEAFTFGTRLTRVTRELDTPHVDDALSALAGTVVDADGGTRIGVALQQLLADGRSVALARGALVIVLSDGLERGDPAEMRAAARRLSRLAHRLVWWSPLACDAAYRPLTRGMQAILPELDWLAGARDLPTLTLAVRGLPEITAGPRRAAGRAWSTA